MIRTSVAILTVLIAGGCKSRSAVDSETLSKTPKVLNYTEPGSESDGIPIKAYAETSTAPSADFKESYMKPLAAGAAQMGAHMKDMAEAAAIAKANDLLFSAVSEISYSQELEDKQTIGVKLKRNLIENPLKDLQTLVPNYTLPAIAMIDRYTVTLGFPIFGTSAPVAPGLKAGFSVGTKGTVEVLNMRTFSDPRAKSEWGVLDNKSKSWLAAKALPKWIKDHTPDVAKAIQKSSIGKKVLDEVTKEQVSRYSTITNLVTFPVKLPFTRDNANDMLLNDVFAYDAYGTATLGVNLKYGIATPGEDAIVKNFISLVPGASIGAETGATAYVIGKWRLAIQKASAGKMKVKLSEVIQEKEKLEASLKAKASIMLKVKIKDGIVLEPGTTFSHKGVNLEVTRTQADTFTRVYEYQIGTDDTKEVNKDAWIAYMDALKGNFETSDMMIYKYAKHSDKAVVFVESMTESKKKTKTNGALNIMIANWTKASTVQIADRNIELESSTIYSISSYVEHKRQDTHAHLAWTPLTFSGQTASVPYGYNWANRDEKYTFAIINRIEHNFLKPKEKDSIPEISILARWDYLDSEVSTRDFTYLEGFFNKVFGYKENETKFVQALYDGFGSSSEMMKEAMVTPVPFEGQMSLGLLPRMISECVTMCQAGYVDPFLLMYKAFSLDPDAVPEYQSDIEDPWLLDTVTMPMPLITKPFYPTAISSLKEAMAAETPQEQVTKFSQLVSHASTAPQMFAFFSYLAAATINGTTASPYMGKIFELTSPVLVDGKELDPTILIDRLSMNFSAISGQMKYGMNRNSDVFNKILTEIMDATKSSIDAAD